MPHFRLTVRHGTPQRYHVADIEAADLEHAVRLAAGQMPAGAEHADLLELRLQSDPDDRSYVTDG